MSTEQIKIIQNILTKQNRFDLSIKLENAYFEHYYTGDTYDGGSLGGLNIFVHPNNFMELNSIAKQDIELLLKLFDGLPHNYTEIVAIRFSINTDTPVETVGDTLYIFVDEAGDMDFSAKGSRFYMFSFLVKKRPFNLHEYISNYRYKLLECNLDPLHGRRLDIEAFHACEDNKYIKQELFSIISTFNTQAVQVYSYILEKPKVLPSKREEKDKFYIDNLKFAIERLLDRLEIKRNFIIITDSLPVRSNKNNQIKALKEGTGDYLKNNKLKIRYDIFHHCSASSANLQIIDYISWAIFRKYEHSDGSYYDIIKKYILEEENMTKDRIVEHYKK